MRGWSRIARTLCSIVLLACGSRTDLESPHAPDAFVPPPDAGMRIDAFAELDASDDPSLVAIAITVTLGEDSLGDTDAFRPQVSEAFAFVRLSDGSSVEVGLNEGTTWNAYTTHRRDIDLRSLWENVRSVGIRHEAAGNDWNADNWTMNEVVIASVSASGRETERYRERGAPVWQFRKNDNQVWEREL